MAAKNISGQINSRKVAKEGSKMHAFLEGYVSNGGDYHQAWLDAKLCKANMHQAKAHLREHWHQVEEMLIRKIGGHVPFAIEGIVQLAKSAKAESVRLKALQDLLSRAGYDAVMRIETKQEAVENMSDAAIEQELLDLINKLGFKHEDGEVSVKEEKCH